MDQIDLIVNTATIVIAIGVAYAISLLLKKQQNLGDNSHFISREKEISNELKLEREKNETLNSEVAKYKSENQFLEEYFSYSKDCTQLIVDQINQLKKHRESH